MNSTPQKHLEILFQRTGNLPSGISHFKEFTQTNTARPKRTKVCWVHYSLPPRSSLFFPNPNKQQRLSVAIFEHNSALSNVRWKLTVQSETVTFRNKTQEIRACNLSFAKNRGLVTFVFPWGSFFIPPWSCFYVSFRFD
jgi:hypothetical protein